jgi:hypothetical protein
LQGVKSFGVRFLIIFQIVLICDSWKHDICEVKCENFFYVNDNFYAIVAPCDLRLIVTYASTLGNDIL